MKKLITITSILAAGTLAANAATVFVFNNSTLSTGVTNISASDDASSHSGTSNGITATLGSLSAGKYFPVVLTGDEYLNNDGTGTGKYLLKWDTSLWTNSSALTALSTGTGLTSAQLKSIDKDDNIGTGGGQPYTLTFSGLTANTTYLVSVIISAVNSDAASTLALTSGTLSTTMTSKYGSLTDTSWDTISSWDSTEENYLTVTAKQTYAISAYITADSSGKIAINNSVAGKSALSMIAISTIPEPSLFGLLAGTLALGLAGTRRRRRAGTQK